MKLAALFFVTAILYAAVGFGGGSTYNALLVLANTNYLILPSIALICNIIVVTGGTYRFQSKKLIPWKQLWPLFILSVPLAWLGGRIEIGEAIFVLLLGLALLVAGVAMLFQHKSGRYKDPDKRPIVRSGYFIPIIGAALGLLSGLVGIGGGIFLAPILHLLRWAGAKVIAGSCSAFILVNSLAGLGGQMVKLQDLSRLQEVLAYWPLFLAVLIGGQIGSLAGSGWLNPDWVMVMTALLILFVAFRLLVPLFLRIV